MRRCVGGKQNERRHYKKTDNERYYKLSFHPVQKLAQLLLMLKVASTFERLALELGRRPRIAFNQIARKDDEIHAIGRLGRMTCLVATHDRLRNDA